MYFNFLFLIGARNDTLIIDTGTHIRQLLEQTWFNNLGEGDTRISFGTNTRAHFCSRKWPIRGYPLSGMITFLNIRENLVFKR